MGLVFLLIAFSAGYYVASNTSKNQKDITKEASPPIVPPSKVTGDALELTATNELPATVKATPVALLAPKPETRNQGQAESANEVMDSAVVFNSAVDEFGEVAFKFQVRSGKQFDDFVLVQDTPYRKGKPMHTVKVDSDCPGYDLVRGVKQALGKTFKVTGRRQDYKGQKQVLAMEISMVK
jgi:hypothetical protein